MINAARQIVLKLDLHCMQGKAFDIFWFQISSPEDPVR